MRGARQAERWLLAISREKGVRKERERRGKDRLDRVIRGEKVEEENT